MIAVIFIVLIIGVILYFKLKADPKDVKKLYEGRNKEQKDSIRYFLVKNSCLRKTMSDADYDAMIRRKVDSLKLREKAINKIGLDEDEIKEIEPVCLEGYIFGDKNWQKRGDDKLWRSSKYEVTWIFASDKQLYIYSYQFNTDEDGKRERSEEYFWKDITNFSTINETEEVGIDWDEKQQKYMNRTNIDTQSFAIIVPGDKYICAMRENEKVEESIRAMKAKLREKKNA